MIVMRDNEWKKGIVEEKVNIKSYNVKTEDGGIYRGEIGDI
jgi:hypothetical protein